MKVNMKFIRKKMIDMDIKSMGELHKKINMCSDAFNKKMRSERQWKLNELWRLSQTLDCEVQELLIIEKEEV